MSFKPVRKMVFMPEKSVGDPMESYVVVPNLALMVSN